MLDSLMVSVMSDSQSQRVYHASGCRCIMSVGQSQSRCVSYMVANLRV